MAALSLGILVAYLMFPEQPAESTAMVMSPRSRLRVNHDLSNERIVFDPAPSSEASRADTSMVTAWIDHWVERRDGADRFAASLAGGTGIGWLECELRPKSRVAVGHYRLLTPPTWDARMPAMSGELIVIDGRARLPVYSEQGTLRVRTEHGAALLDWSDAQEGATTTCDGHVELLPGLTVVRGLVLDDGGRRVVGAYVRSPSGSADSEADGSFYLVVDPGETSVTACTMAPARRDTGIRYGGIDVELVRDSSACSEALPLMLEPGEEVVVDLVIGAG